MRTTKSRRSSSSLTIADVARLAGVSPSTVSRVINEPALVRQDTIDAVERAISQIGYTPNFLAGGLASNRTKLIGVVVPAISNSIFADTVQAVTDTLAAEGYQALVGVTDYDMGKEDDLLRAIIGRRPDGLILTGTLHSSASRARLLSAQVPIVETWDLTPTPLDMVVGFSHAGAGQAIARYLADKGYRRFGLLFSNDQRARIRLEALSDELETRGCISRTTIVAPVNDISLGRRGLSDLLDGDWSPDAIVCSSDALALGVLAGARDRKARVPDDFAVMGFGALDFGEFTSPSLSTVRVDRTELGRQAANALLARLRGESLARHIVDVGFSIVSRQSA